MAYFLKQNEYQNNQNQQTQNVGGNIYSTSGGEVSSQIDNNSNSSNSSNSNSSNSSGNWVNLNSYLDANQNKAGRYANTFVESDLNKGQDYKNNLQNAQDQYLSSIKSDTAYNYSNNDNNLLDRYLQNSSSLSSAEKNRAMNILKGYQGDDYFQNTGDKYGYNELKKGSDDFNTLSKNILNENYLKSQMGNNVSTGGKNLNSFVLGGSNDSRNVLNNASNQFSEISSLLDSTNNTLNNERNNVVNKATENQKAYDKARQEKVDQLTAELESAYNQAKTKNDNIINRYQKNYDDAWALPYGSTTNDGYVKYYRDTTNNAKSQLEKEKQELKNRNESLLGLSDLNGNSKIDSNFTFSEWVDPTDQQKAMQSEIAKDFDNEFLNNLGISGLAGEDPVFAESLLALKQAMMRGDINKEQAWQYIETHPSYLNRYIIPALQQQGRYDGTVGANDWRDFQRSIGIINI